MKDTETKTSEVPVKAVAKKEKKAAPRPPTAAQLDYDKLVSTPITGWDEDRIKEHKKKCCEALAAKRQSRR